MTKSAFNNDYDKPIRSPRKAPNRTQTPTKLISSTYSPMKGKEGNTNKTQSPMKERKKSSISHSPMKGKETNTNKTQSPMKTIFHSSINGKESNTHPSRGPFASPSKNKEQKSLELDSTNFLIPTNTKRISKPIKLSGFDLGGSAPNSPLRKNKLNETTQNLNLTEKRFVCDEVSCNYSSNKKEEFNAHKRTHLQEKPFKCEMCKYSSMNVGNLNRHKRIHTGDKKFKCSICNYAATDSSALTAHHKRNHAGAKPFRCHSCNFTAVLKDRLDAHISRKHNGNEKKIEIIEIKKPASHIDEKKPKKFSEAFLRCLGIGDDFGM